MFDPIWPGAIVAIATILRLIGSLAGVIAGIASSGNDYPEAHLDRNFSGLRTATPARRLGGSLLDGLIFVFTLAIGWLIWFSIIAPRGQTPGKSLVSTYVIRKDGSRAGGWYMWGRDVGVKWLVVGFVDTFLLGMLQFVSALWILWDRDKQCLWDKVVGSYVAYAPLGDPTTALIPNTETAARLQELQSLHTDGVISAEEYEQRRRRVMGEQ